MQDPERRCDSDVIPELIIHDGETMMGSGLAFWLGLEGSWAEKDSSRNKPAERRYYNFMLARKKTMKTLHERKHRIAMNKFS